MMPGRPDSERPAARTGKPGLRRAANWRVGEESRGYLVHDGEHALRTPAGHEVIVPSRRLAETIADEMRAQTGAARPDIARLPNLRLAATAIDRVAVARDAHIDALLAYGETELLCYRAEHPADLVERQHAAWQPLLDWAAARFGAALANTAGIMPRRQAPVAIAALRATLAGLDDPRLAALSVAVQTSGSLIVGLAMVEGRLDAAGAFETAELDETWQIERWGEQPEAAQRRTRRRADLAQVELFLDLLKSG